MLLDTADRLVEHFGLHVGRTAYLRFKRHAALIAAFNEFLRVTEAVLTNTPVTLVNGIDTVDLAATITGMEQDDYKRGSIDGYRVGLVPVETIAMRHRGGGPPAGRPGMIAHRDDGLWMLDTTTDQEYTLDVTHPAYVAFEPGSRGAFDAAAEYELNDVVTHSGTAYRYILQFPSIPAAPPSSAWIALPSSTVVADPMTYDLPCPTKYAKSIAKWGGISYLFFGAPGHPDATPAAARFVDTLAEAREEYARRRANVRDAGLPPSLQRPAPQAAESR